MSVACYRCFLSARSASRRRCLEQFKAKDTGAEFSPSDAPVKRFTALSPPYYQVKVLKVTLCKIVVSSEPSGVTTARSRGKSRPLPPFSSSKPFCSVSTASSSHAIFPLTATSTPVSILRFCALLTAEQRAVPFPAGWSRPSFRPPSSQATLTAEAPFAKRNRCNRSLSLPSNQD